MADSKSTNRPFAIYKAFPLEVAVWQKEVEKDSGDKKFRTTATVSKNYKDKDGNWKSTKSFDLNDLPRLALLLQQAHVDFGTSIETANIRDA